MKAGPAQSWEPGLNTGLPCGVTGIRYLSYPLLPRWGQEAGTSAQLLHMEDRSPHIGMVQLLKADRGSVRLMFDSLPDMDPHGQENPAAPVSSPSIFSGSRCSWDQLVCLLQHVMGSWKPPQKFLGKVQPIPVLFKALGTLQPSPAWLKVAQFPCYGAPGVHEMVL